MMETTDSLSLGQQLKNAREALNLSIDDVAQKTNLKRNHIDALENDIFVLQNVPPAFVRGYVRNYVRFLCLPEEWVNSVNYGEVTLPKETKRVAPIKVSNHKSQVRWVKMLTCLILLAAIGMTLAWWWQEHKKDEANREQFVATAENSVTINTQSDSNQVNSNNDVVINQNAMTSTHNEANVANDNNVVVNGADNQQPVETQPVQAVVEQPVSVASTTVNSEVMTNPAASETTNVLNQQTVQTEELAQADQPTAVGNDELRIEITSGQSWITVKGVKGKRLAEKLYNAGDVLTFNSNEQYRLTVGAPANVKIYYKGQIVPLKVDGRVARFKLPLAN